MNSSPSHATENRYRNTFKAECDRRRSAGLLLTGNTYPYRETLGKDGLGGIWDSYEKGWLMPTREAYEKGLALVNRPPKPRGKKPAAVKAPEAPAPAAALVPEFEAAPSASTESSEDMPF